MGQGDIRATLWRSPCDCRSPRTAARSQGRGPAALVSTLDGWPARTWYGGRMVAQGAGRKRPICARPRVAAALRLGRASPSAGRQGHRRAPLAGLLDPHHIEGEQASRASGRGAPTHPDPSRPAPKAGGIAPRPGVPLVSLSGPGAARQRRRLGKREPGRYAHGLALNQPISGPQDATAPVMCTVSGP